MKTFICIAFLCSIALVSALPLLGLASSGSSTNTQQAGLSLGGLVHVGGSKTQSDANAQSVVTNGNPIAPVGSEAGASASSTNHNLNAGILGIPLINLNSGQSNTQTHTVVRQ